MRNERVHLDNQSGLNEKDIEIQRLKGKISSLTIKVTVTENLEK